MAINKLRKSLFALLFILTGSVHADVLVLVHGWSANSETWLHSGVVPVLESNGWKNAGIVTMGPQGVHRIAGHATQSGNYVYRVNLPAEAPMLIQANLLQAQLTTIVRQHPEEPIHLAGHSAGGIVARLVLIRQDAPKVTSLITIASPNLGTGRAIQGLDIAESKPFFCPGPGVNIVKSMFGGERYDYLRYSRGALVDLVPANPGTLIYWLNQQPHPDIKYHAIVRTLPGQGGDELVPAFSQDLSQVPALRGRVKVHVINAGHGLFPADGKTLTNILANL